MLDPIPDERYVPRARYDVRKGDEANLRMLSGIGEECYTCLKPIAECTCPNEDDAER